MTPGTLSWLDVVGGVAVFFGAAFVLFVLLVLAVWTFADAFDRWWGRRR